MRVGTQGLFHTYLKTFVPPFLPTRLTGSPRMAIYHRFDGILAWKRGWWMVYLLLDEAAWAVGNRSTSFPSTVARLPVFFFFFKNELKKWLLRLSEDEIDEILTKTERKKCKDTQNVSIARWMQSTF